MCWLGNGRRLSPARTRSHRLAPGRLHRAVGRGVTARPRRAGLNFTQYGWDLRPTEVGREAFAETSGLCGELRAPRAGYRPTVRFHVRGEAAPGARGGDTGCGCAGEQGDEDRGAQRAD